MVWATAIYALTQLRHLEVVTTPHLLVAVGLLVAAIAVTIGAWVGLDNAVGDVLPVPHDNGVGAQSSRSSPRSPSSRPASSSG